MKTTHTTETFETFPARVGHIRAALYNLRYRRAKSMPMHVALRAESLLCYLGERVENGETCALGSLESFLLCGARNWTHYAASACQCAEVCQETIIRDFYENSPESAEFYVRKMYADRVENDFCVKLEGAMLGRAFRVVEAFMLGQFEEYKAVREVDAIKDAANTVQPGKDVFFAFGREQFAEALAQSGLDASEVVAFGAGCYGTREGIKAFLQSINSRLDALKNCHPDALFAYEFANHECGYTREHSEALEATHAYFPDYEPTDELLHYLYYADNEEFYPLIHR
jgi:hypothetical protein